VLVLQEGGLEQALERREKILLKNKHFKMIS
jgi:hypothetical protein